MSELNATSYDIHLHLQNILVRDVGDALTSLRKKLEYFTNSDEECRNFILSVQEYLASSQTIINTIIKWNTMQILSDNYSSSLNFQVNLTTSLLQDQFSDEHLLMKNNTIDVPGTRFSIPLLKLVLLNLLRYAAQRSNATFNLEIANYLKSDKLIVCLIFAEMHENLRDLVTNMKTKDFAVADSQILLSLGYKFLQFYECDIWLESLEKPGLRLCFSIPANNSH